MNFLGSLATQQQTNWHRGESPGKPCRGLVFYCSPFLAGRSQESNRVSPRDTENFRAHQFHHLAVHGLPDSMCLFFFFCVYFLWCHRRRHGACCHAQLRSPSQTGHAERHKTSHNHHFTTKHHARPNAVSHEKLGRLDEKPCTPSTHPATPLRALQHGLFGHSRSRVCIIQLQLGSLTNSPACFRGVDADSRRG